jgi:formamidopyrimidine-DNA glycosylase
VPELPEVEVLARHLRCRLRGKVFQKVGVCRNKGLAEGFTRKTFTAMIEGVREQAVAKGLIGADSFDRGMAGRSKCSATSA